MRWRERKLHILLGEGLAALAKCEKDTENYTIDMSDWAVTQNGKCAVCLAGATFPKHIHREEGRSGLYSRLPKVAQAMYALDCLRWGNTRDAARELNLSRPVACSRYVTPYDKNRKQWWKDMRKLKAELKRRNE